MENTNFEISLTQLGDVIIGLSDKLLNTNNLEIINIDSVLYLTDGAQTICLKDLPFEFYSKIQKNEKMYFSYKVNNQLELKQVNVK